MITLLLVGLSLVAVATARSEGAPEGACSSMTPAHGTQNPGQGSFTIATSSNSITQQEITKVTLSTSGNPVFKGFLLRTSPRNAGTFSNLSPGTKLSCNNDAVTHSSKTEKTSIYADWKPSPAFKGSLKFVATVVVDYNNYYKDIQSSDVQVSGSETTDGAPTTGDITPTKAPGTETTDGAKGVTSTMVPGNETTDGVPTTDSVTPTVPMKSAISDPECGVSKGCFPDCKSTTCSFLVTWKNQPQHTEFDVMSSSVDQSTANFWMAVGFSKDNKMGDDSVVACVANSGIVTAQVGYNPGYSYTPLADRTTGLSDVSGTIADGIFRCRFRRQKNVTGESKFFDLNRRWHVLFAHGLATGVDINKHPDTPVASQATVDFLTTDTASVVQIDYILTKVHVEEGEVPGENQQPATSNWQLSQKGSLMSIAWMLFSSIGIITARFFKPAWPNSKIAGQKIWFQIHRACMLTVLLFTVIGVIVIFVDIGGYSDIQVEESISFAKAHPILGLVVASLTVVNPVMAIFRCSPGHKNRPIFNFFHTVVGISAYIIAGIAIIFGTYLDRSGLDRKATYTVIAYIVTFTVAVIILEINEALAKRKKKDFDISTEMTDITKGHVNGPGRSETAKTEDESGMLFKKIILVVLSLCMVGYSIAIIVLLN